MYHVTVNRTHLQQHYKLIVFTPIKWTTNIDQRETGRPRPRPVRPLVNNPRAQWKCIRRPYGGTLRPDGKPRHRCPSQSGHFAAECKASGPGRQICQESDRVNWPSGQSDTADGHVHQMAALKKGRPPLTWSSLLSRPDLVPSPWNISFLFKLEFIVALSACSGRDFTSGLQFR